MPDGLVVRRGGPGGHRRPGASRSASHSSPRLQQLPPRQRAVLILCEVLRWKAAEVAELLDTTVASVNSALQRARATLEASELTRRTSAASVETADPELLRRYVAAFESYDMEALTALIQEDATQSMPPFDLWLAGRDDIFAWWVGPGNGCRGSRVVPVESANGAPAFGQYKPAESGDGYEPWALQVLEIERREDRRAHVLPRHGDDVPALRAAAALRRPRLSDGSVREEVFDDLGVAGRLLAEDDELQAVVRSLEAPRHLGPDPDRVEPLDIDLLLVEVDLPSCPRARRRPPRSRGGGARRRGACRASRSGATHRASRGPDPSRRSVPPGSSRTRLRRPCPRRSPRFLSV